jgi:hypothetical protein
MGAAAPAGVGFAGRRLAAARLLCFGAVTSMAGRLSDAGALPGGDCCCASWGAVCAQALEPASDASNTIPANCRGAMNVPEIYPSAQPTDPRRPAIRTLQCRYDEVNKTAY